MGLIPPKEEHVTQATNRKVTSPRALEGDVLASTIESELRHDALTASLAIEVEVWARVVHLRGTVPGPSDAEAAESVAERVDGVGLVADDLEIRRAPE
jgi:osmotically-inducible protein OsmY